MKKPKKLFAWDLPDTHMEPDGYDMKSVPELTLRNFETLLEEYNNLVECFNAMAEFNGFYALNVWEEKNEQD
jgi:hypothetical protein